MIKEKKSVLIIDDEQNLRSSLAEFLELEGFKCIGAEDGSKGLSLLEKEVFDAILLDLRMPRISGLEVLQTIRERGLDIVVIMMSAHGEIDDAVSAMKLGADDYLVKPFDPSELVLRLSRAVNSHRLQTLSKVHKRLSSENSAQNLWLGDDPSMAEVVSLVRRVAPVQTTVLITGDSGTGKEVVARAIHSLSPRSEAAFVPVNVAAIPESLQESELFGYEKGSFTGADNRKPGLFELASGGTLFLDELGEMSLSLQVKLLRVLQERVVVRVGGIKSIPVDVRIIGATNKNLETALANGLFREDLYFRLNVIRIKIPALRDRPSDIPVLASLFLAKISRETGKQISSFSAEALEMLSSYHFPGNVRELQNLVERAVILCEGSVLRPEDFGLDQLGPKQKNVGLRSGSVKEAERIAIIAALELTKGHREKTAAELGITRRTLLNKMKEHNLL